jgi:protein transport protein SEC61 subunit alpha
MLRPPSSGDDPTNVLIYLSAFFLTTLGIIYVQEAERRIPINYSGRAVTNSLSRQSYLPFKVGPNRIRSNPFQAHLSHL